MRQSILPRTASAACREVRFSTYCMTVTRAKRQGAVFRLPFLGKETRKILVGVNASQHVAQRPRTYCLLGMRFVLSGQSLWELDKSLVL